MEWDPEGQKGWQGCVGSLEAAVWLPLAMVAYSLAVGGRGQGGGGGRRDPTRRQAKGEEAFFPSYQAVSCV